MQKVNEGNMNSLRESGLMLAFFFFFPLGNLSRRYWLLTGNQESFEDMLVSFFLFFFLEMGEKEGKSPVEKERYQVQ